MTCKQCVRCSIKDCDAIAYCLSEPEGQYPICDQDDLDHRLARERRMHETGDWSGTADPFFIPANQERDHAYWTTELDAHTESVRRYYKKGPA